MTRLRTPRPFIDPTPDYLAGVADWLFAALPEAWHDVGHTRKQDEGTGDVRYVMRGTIGAQSWRVSSLLVYADLQAGAQGRPLVRVEWTQGGDPGNALRLQEHLGRGEKPDVLRRRLRKHVVYVVTRREVAGLPPVAPPPQGRGSREPGPVDLGTMTHCTAPLTTTVFDVLTLLGLVGRLVVDRFDRFEAPVTSWCWAASTSGLGLDLGALQGYVGDDTLLLTLTGPKVSFGVVQDDSRGREWDARGRHLGQHGARPWARLVLVELARLGCWWIARPLSRREAMTMSPVIVLTTSQIRSLRDFAQIGGHGYGENSYVPSASARVLARHGFVQLGFRSMPGGRSLRWGVVTQAGVDWYNAQGFLIGLAVSEPTYGFRASP